MWQVAGAVSGPQCTKDKHKLAFSWSCIKSPMRWFRKDSRGKWLSDVSVPNAGSKALMIPRAGNSIFILFCPRKDFIDSDLLMLTSFANFLVLREHCPVKGWKIQLSSGYKPLQTPNRLLSIYKADVPPKSVYLQTPGVFLNKSLVWQQFHQSLFQHVSRCAIVHVSSDKSVTVGFLVAVLFALPYNLVILMQGTSFQVLERRILSFSHPDAFSSSKHQPQGTSRPLSDCKSDSPFKPSFPFPSFHIGW